MRLYASLVLLSLATLAQATSDPIMTLVPNMTQIYVRSDGYAMVEYSVTNSTAGAKLFNLKIFPENQNQTSVFNDNCTGTNLNPGQTCVFDMMINGSQLDRNIQLSPKVCANNNTVCSQAYGNLRPFVNYAQITHPVRAYIALSDTAYTLSIITPIPVSTAVPDPQFTSTDLNFTLDWYVGTSLSFNGNILYAMNDNSTDLVVLDVSQQTPSVITTIPITTSGIPQAVVAHPNGQTVYASAYFDENVYVIDTETYAVVNTLPLDSGSQAFFLSLSPDGKRLYVVDDNNLEVFVFDTTSDSTSPLTVLMPSTSYLFSATTDPENQLLYVPDPDAPQIFLYDIQDNYNSLTPLDVSSEFSFVKLVVFSSNGEIAYVCDNESVMPYEVSTWTPLLGSPIFVGQFIQAMSLDPTGRYLYVAPWMQPYVTVIDTSDYSSTNIDLDPNSDGLSPNNLGSFIG